MSSVITSPNLSAADVARFWASTIESGECLDWRGPTSRSYPVFLLEGRQHQAHRIAYVLSFGPIPPGRCVMRRCGNTVCVAPAHLYLASPRRPTGCPPGRPSRGRGGGRLNSRDVMLIRQAYAEGGVTQRELAERYRVTPAAIGKITRGESWAHLDPQHTIAAAQPRCVMCDADPLSGDDVSRTDVRSSPLSPEHTGGLRPRGASR